MSEMSLLLTELIESLPYELKTNSSRNKLDVWSRSRKIGVLNQFWSDLSAVKREICSTRCCDQVDIIILVVDPLLNE